MAGTVEIKIYLSSFKSQAKIAPVTALSLSIELPPDATKNRFYFTRPQHIICGKLCRRNLKFKCVLWHRIPSIHSLVASKLLAGDQWGGMAA